MWEINCSFKIKNMPQTNNERVSFHIPSFLIGFFYNAWIFTICVAFPAELQHFRLFDKNTIVTEVKKGDKDYLYTYKVTSPEKTDEILSNEVFLIGDTIKMVK